MISYPLSPTRTTPYSDSLRDWEFFVDAALKPTGLELTMINLVMLKAGQVGIAILGQFQIESQSRQENEGRPVFDLSVSLALRPVACCKSIMDHIQALPATETQFAGSKPFLAFKIQYSPSVLPTGSTLPEAILDTNKIYNQLNMSLQRIPNSWVAFNNGIEGLKFRIPGFEMRVHSPEYSLLEMKIKESEILTTRTHNLRMRQLTFQQKLETAQRTKNESQIATFKQQFEEASKKIKSVAESLQTSYTQGNSNAAIYPILRGICESQLDQNGLKQHTLQVLFAIKALIREHLLNAGVIKNCHNTPLENSKIRFLENALSLISSRLSSIGPAPEPDSASMPDYLKQLKDLLDYRVGFLSLNDSHANATNCLSSHQNYLLSQLQQTVDELENKLDGHVENRLDALCRKDLDLHGEMAISLMLERIKVIDEALIETGLLEINNGARTYFTSIEYDERRIMFDQQLQTLLCSLLLNMLYHHALDPNNTLHAELVKIEKLSVMKSHPFYTCLNDDLKTLLPGYETEIDQLKTAWETLWSASTIDEMNVARTSALDLSNLKQKLLDEKDNLTFNPDASFPSPVPDAVKPDMKAYKQAESTRTRDNLLCMAAIGYKHSSVNPFFENQAIKGLDLMIQIIDSIDSLVARRYMCQMNHSIAPIKHFFWTGASEIDDPHYKSNETHIPIPPRG
ncbi:MAG: hypothetical protein H7A40_06100 [Chlamydiales bacterium]|nr:hypothetical protein [Chlamydiales bacterium]